MSLRTKAGRQLFARLWAVNDYAGASQAIATVEGDILAIEREASVLDVERLARAIHDVAQDVTDAGYTTGTEDWADAMATAVAREYAALDLTEGVSSTQHG